MARRLMSACRNIGLSSSSSERALNARAPTFTSFAHEGTRPQRAGSRRRVGGSVLAESRTIPTCDVGAMLYDGVGRSSLSTSTRSTPTSSEATLATTKRPHMGVSLGGGGDIADDVDVGQTLEQL